LKPNFHSPLRRYYIARNGVRTALDYGGLWPVYVGLIFFRLSHELLSALLFEDRKMQKLKAMGHGVVHGLVGRMGPCPLTVLLGGDCDRGG
jgi:rhamnosyltransferase